MTMRKIYYFLITLIFTMFIISSHVQAQPVSNKAYHKRVELLGYLRELETIVKNYPILDEKWSKDQVPEDDPQPKGRFQGDNVSRYDRIKRLFQQGMVYYYEQNYVNSYTRLLEAQLEIEQLLEDISQFYINGTEEMLKSALDRKNENDPTDKDVISISIEYGPGSKIREHQLEPREAPKIKRQYEPKEYHYVLNKYAIEQNIAMGYRKLSEAKKHRIKALKFENHLEKHQMLTPKHRKYRIESYLAVIHKCREARANALEVFKLKYPYDNYYLTAAETEEKYGKLAEGNSTEKSTLKFSEYDEGKKQTTEAAMRYNNNPYVDYKNLNPVFDQRIPEEYKRDAVDLLDKVYEEEIDHNIRLKYDPETRERNDALKYETYKLKFEEPKKSTPSGSGEAKTPADKPAADNKKEAKKTTPPAPKEKPVDKKPKKK